MNTLKTLMSGTVLSLALLGSVLTPAYADKINASGKNPPLTTGTSPADIDIATPIDAIDFGDDTSEWANDGECDDPRFAGTASAAELLDEDIRKDATDCRAAYEAGTVTLAPADGSDVTNTTATTEDTAVLPDFGDDSSDYADDGECDDPRFTGTGMADEPLLSDTGKDATDCRTAFEAGTVTLEDADSATLDTPATVATTNDDDIDYGDDTSDWANDDECDDPRFSGTGVADQLLDEDKGHDATDCRAAVEAGTATYNGETTVAPFDYGSDISEWANDGECDDPRFIGAGVDKKLLDDDLRGDATDCQAAVDAGTATIRTVYTPEYAAGSPYDSSDIDFGDNTSDYANDEICDDPRFEGPSAASILLDDDRGHDSVDCKAAFEAGLVVMKDGEA